MRSCFVSVAFSMHFTWGVDDDCWIVFNNAEESLQDGSQLFSTQHPIAHTHVDLYVSDVPLLTIPFNSVRAVINLEGMSLQRSAHIVAHTCHPNSRRHDRPRAALPGNF